MDIFEDNVFLKEPQFNRVDINCPTCKSIVSIAIPPKLYDYKKDYEHLIKVNNHLRSECLNMNIKYNELKRRLESE